MKKLLLGLTSALILAGCQQTAAPQAATGDAGAVSALGSSVAANRNYVVVFRNEQLPAGAAERVKAAGGKVGRQLGGAGVLIASGNAAFAAKLAKDSAVLAVGPEHLYSLPDLKTARLSATDAQTETIGAPTKADRFYSYQWDMRRMNGPVVWSRIPLEAQRKVTVAVLDVGVMDTHPDLVGQVVDRVGTNYCREADVNGNESYPVYSRLIDFTKTPDFDSSKDSCVTVPANEVTYEDHGTHVAGTVAGKFGGGGIVGLAPGVGIAAYKVFDRYRLVGADGKVADRVGGFDGPIFAAIMDAANKGYAVVNMSLGSALDRSNKDDNASYLAWNRVARYATKKGTLIVASAGNSAENSNGTVAHIPSDLPGVVSVSATGSNDLRIVNGQYTAQPGSDVLAFYSNYGASTDVSAPGGDCGPGYPNTCDAPYLILSSIIDTDGTPWYGFLAGTSMASPHVAAVAALVKSVHPTWTPNEIRDQLKSTAQAVGDRQKFGQGLVDADAATR
ncbi:S8 family serine peptidase [Deinococcus pimensis]|uniref:S8 family serine peptidase n=1 Tax=Deinococcus pimensis TaxID=309888 RepID=UPI00047FB942|nr:S8 family serine peptidase [Deinococcus pimensis]